MRSWSSLQGDLRTRRRPLNFCWDLTWLEDPPQKTVWLLLLLIIIVIVIIPDSVFFLSGLLLLILDFRRNSWPVSWISLSDLIQVFVQIFVTSCHLYSGQNRPDNKPKSHMCFQRKEIWSISHRIHVWYIYANTGGILMGSMLPYMAAPWIRHGYWSHGSARTLWKTTHRTGRLLRTYLGVESEAPDLKSLMLQDHRLSEQAP